MQEELRLHDIGFGQCPLIGPSLYVWVQGCPRRCPGCFNTGALDGPGTAVSTEALARLCLESGRNIVLSGGEPFSQSSGLAETCRIVRSMKPELLILAYTGYYLEELLTGVDSGRTDLLKEIDVVVDGPFEREYLTDNPLTGSGNQRVFLLSSRILPQNLQQVQAPQIQVSLSGNNLVRIIGTGQRDLDMNALVEVMRSCGVELEEV